LRNRDLPEATAEITEATAGRPTTEAAAAAIAAAGLPVEVILLAEVVAMPAAAADTPEAEVTGRSNAGAWFFLSKTSCCKRSEDSRGEKGRANRHALFL
jgi:hypothetical protein